MDPWLARVRHDLVKRAVWTARDLRELGSVLRGSDLRALQAGLRELIDEEGKPIDAHALWARLREAAPAEASLRPGFAQACDALAEAIDAADAAVQLAAGDRARVPLALDAVLRIEDAFAALARSMNPRI